MTLWGRTEDMDEKVLIKHAMDARERSYSPYSQYRVGAALLCGDDTVFTGCNIENASYPATVCAERVAVGNAVANGRRDITAIAIVGGKSGETGVLTDYAFPCGICRQVLREFSDPASFTVIVARSTDDYKKYKLEELIPESFGPDHLL